MGFDEVYGEVFCMTLIYIQLSFVILYVILIFIDIKLVCLRVFKYYSYSFWLFVFGIGMLNSFNFEIFIYLSLYFIISIYISIILDLSIYYFGFKKRKVQNVYLNVN